VERDSTEIAELTQSLSTRGGHEKSSTRQTWIKERSNSKQTEEENDVLENSTGEKKSNMTERGRGERGGKLRELEK